MEKETIRPLPGAAAGTKKTGNEGLLLAINPIGKACEALSRAENQPLMRRRLSTAVETFLPVAASRQPGRKVSHW